MFRKTGSNKMRNSWMSYFRVKELEKGSEHIKKKKTIDHIRGRKWEKWRTYWSRWKTQYPVTEQGKE